jgi:hypothetical protein
MTFWVEHSAHELYKLRACSRQLRLHRSFGDPQNLRGLTCREAIQLAQLERCAHRRRKLLKELHEALTQLRLRTFLFRSWSAIRQPFRQRIFLLIPEWLIKREVNGARPFA